MLVICVYLFCLLLHGKWVINYLLSCTIRLLLVCLTNFFLYFRQNATLPSPNSPVTSDQQTATTMPQQQSNIVRSTATVHPYSVDTRGMAVSINIQF